ncbi:uncharacterized protein LOC121384982 [Gigantopelta aegis]|uniref:uncharacterized protein LOC121384982 n=1 Tax=Gigantopelta aegis TaxID=1735272 RepID=UPI001B88D1C8|nr:uncharacterized protein LOC121384982 [Gigantopelta aegis]
MTEQQRMEVNRTNGKKVFSNELLENFDVKESNPVDPAIQGQCGADRKVMDLIPEEEDESTEIKDDAIVKRACTRKLRCTIKLYRLCCRRKTTCVIRTRKVTIRIPAKKCILYRLIHCSRVCV